MSPANGLGPPQADNSHCENELYRDYLLSAAMVSNAFVGQEYNYKSDLKSLKLYYVFRHWSLEYLLYLCLFSIHFLTIFENVGQSRSRAMFVGLTTTVEVLCLVYFVIYLVLRYLVTQRYVFWHDSRVIVLTWAIAMTFLDLVAYFIVPPSKATRFTLCLRPLFLVTFTENNQVGFS